MMFDAFFPAEVKAAFAQVPEFVERWTKFMNALGGRLNLVVEKLDTIDCKLTFLIAETNLTPELHADVVARAAVDPRNVWRESRPE